MSPQITARRYALDQLERIEHEGAYVGFTDDAAALSSLDARDERFASELVAGVTRQRRYLDFLIRHFYRGDASTLEPRLRQVLRLGLYDLLLLRTPPHAAVSEAVELAKTAVRAGAGGLVNGMLRSVLRDKDQLPTPATGDLARDLATRYSHPTWIVRRWLARFGEADTRALLDHDNARPHYGLRANSLKLADEGAFAELLRDHDVAWTPSPWLDDFARLERLQPVIRGGLLAEGLCAVQDESAGLVVRLLDPQPGETILDVCAAPGGKALYAAARMHDRGRVVASDIHEARLGLVASTAERQGATIVETRLSDVRDLARRGEGPLGDRVLLDAPCSGLGVLAKRADLRWRRTPEELRHLAALQSELLEAAAHLVRPGGLLVYATCTIEPEENEERVDRFLEEHDHFELEPARGFVPDALVTPEGYYATLPHRDQIDGAFGARLRRAA